MPSLTGLGIFLYHFPPGTAVPGYRLSRPYGTGPAYGNTTGVSATKLGARRAIGLPSQRSSSSFVSSRRNWHFRRRRVRSPRMLRWATLSRRDLVLRALYHSEHL